MRRQLRHERDGGGGEGAKHVRSPNYNYSNLLGSVERRRYRTAVCRAACFFTLDFSLIIQIKTKQRHEASAMSAVGPRDSQETNGASRKWHCNNTAPGSISLGVTGLTPLCPGYRPALRVTTERFACGKAPRGRRHLRTQGRANGHGGFSQGGWVERGRRAATGKGGAAGSAQSDAASSAQRRPILSAAHSW